MQINIEEGIVYDDFVIFYSHTYKQIIKGCIIKYGNKTEAEANKLIEESDFFNAEFYPPKTFTYLMLHMEHETPYDNAMEIAFGERYLRSSELNISETIPSDYYTWEKNYVKIKGLKEDYLVYLKDK